MRPASKTLSENGIMIARAVPEWIGKTPDSAVPPRVRVRVFDRFDGRCQCGCNRKIFVGEAWDCEDEIAIINGGERRESNLRPFLREHHHAKTREDVAIKSKTYRKRAKHIGAKRNRPSFATNRNGPFRKRMDGTVERRQ